MKKKPTHQTLKTSELPNLQTSKPQNLKTSKPHCLTIAASDTSGGAGIQRDVKAFHNIGVNGLSVITGITAQTNDKVLYAQPLPIEQLKIQFKAVFENYHISSVKIGVIFSREIMECITEYIQKYNPAHVVIDPIIHASDTYSFLDKSGFLFMRDSFLNIADIITPNVPELEKLSGISISSHNDLIKAVRQISQKYDAYIYAKGGHFIVDDIVKDYLIKKDDVQTYSNPNKHLASTHGTGCLISSALTAYLALGNDIHDAIIKTKEYFYTCLL